MEKLSLFDNKLFGAIPSGLGKLARLQELILSDNLLYGIVPSELAELKSIKVLMLNSNQVKGDFANLERKLPQGVQFEYRNLDKMKNSVLATND